MYVQRVRHAHLRLNGMCMYAYVNDHVACTRRASHVVVIYRCNIYRCRVRTDLSLHVSILHMGA